MKNSTAVLSATLVAALSFSSLMPSEARGFRYAGPNGAIGAHAGAWTGANGGTFAGARGGFATRNAGLLGGAFKATGPNGGSANGGALAGWKRGVGGFEGTNLNATGPGGSTYNGFTRGKYNAQTGLGTYNSSRQIKDAQNGKNYGYTDNTSFQKGQGGQSQIDTDNHGDYTVDWSKGQKPVVTQDN